MGAPVLGAGARSSWPVGIDDTPRRPMAIDDHAIASGYDVGDPAASQIGTARDRRDHKPFVKHPSWHNLSRCAQLRVQRAGPVALSQIPSANPSSPIHAQLAERCHSRRRQPVPADLVTCEGRPVDQRHPSSRVGCERSKRRSGSGGSGSDN